jgi:hypothetical protein
MPLFWLSDEGSSATIYNRFNRNHAVASGSSYSTRGWGLAW